METDPAALTPGAALRAAGRRPGDPGCRGCVRAAAASISSRLRGALLFWPEGSDPTNDPPIPFLPPVIEESIERDGTKVLLINDGIHRVYAARKRGRKINVVLARNVPAEYPYYAYALPQGWAQVDELAGIDRKATRRRNIAIRRITRRCSATSMRSLKACRNSAREAIPPT